MMTYADISPIIWPLAALLVSLIILRKLSNSIEPVFQGLISGLKNQASRHSLAWLMALMYASAASLQSLSEVAAALQWVYVAAFAKVVQPAVVAIIAYVNRPPQSLNPPTDPQK